MPLRRIIAERRRLAVLLATVLLANVAAYIFVVRPLAQSSRSAGARASAAARAASEAEGERTIARALVSSKLHVDEELSAFYRNVLPAGQAEAARMTYARLPALARQCNVRYERRHQAVALDKDTRLGVLTIRMELQGEYEGLREFIYRLESAPEFVIVDDVALTERDASQPLTLVISLSTYFRPAGTNGA